MPLNEIENGNREYETTTLLKSRQKREYPAPGESPLLAPTQN